MVVAIAGVAFAVFLIFMELGFLTALLDSTVLLIDRLEADLFLVSPAKFALVVPERFPRQRLLEARGCGVTAQALYMESAYAVLRKPGSRGYPIRVLGTSLDEPIFDLPPEVLRRLSTPWTAAYDEASKPHYGFPRPPQPPEATMELNGKNLRLIGRLHLCTDFATDGTLVLSTENFLRYFPTVPDSGKSRSEWVDIGLLRLENGGQLASVQQCLEKHLAPDVIVLTKDEFKNRERSFWLRSTPIGYIFVVGTVIGLLVGVVVCYQVIHAQVDDHVKEFATLLAMGYSHTYLILLVLSQSLYLAVMGFLPAVLTALTAYAWLSRATGLLLVMRPWLAVIVAFLALFMCFVSGLIALRRLRQADPAGLF